MNRKKLAKLLTSKKALAVPITYLVLFVSLIAVISATYSLAIVKINANGALLKIYVTKQNMQIIDETVHSVAWGFGASEVVYMDDCGGTFQTALNTKRLVINLTDGQLFHDIVFNSSIGEVFYKLEPSEANNDGLFIRGDERAIINQSAYTMTQLYFTTVDNNKRLELCYRPSATAVFIGMNNGKPANLIRIYIINLNSSQSLLLKEKFYLKITSLNVTTITRQYDLNISVSSLALKTTLGNILSTVWLPISSNVQGCSVKLELVVCNIKIQRGAM